MRRSHETWWHLTKGPRYFTGIDEIREPHAGGQSGLAATFKRPKSSHDLVPGQAARQQRDDRPDVPADHPLGKLPGSVWTIPTQPLRVPPDLGIQHFAAFPFELPRRFIRGWSPSGICVECGEGRRPVAVAQHETSAQRAARLGSLDAAIVPGRETRSRPVQSMSHKGGHDTVQAYALTGYACACDAPTAPTRPAVILDPFGGTGTTGVVAKGLGRRAHLVDLSRDYCRLAQWRVNDPRELAKAAQTKPPAKRKSKVAKLRPVAPVQGSLLDDDPAA